MVVPGAPEQQDLASAVRQLQRRGAKDEAGHSWAEWLQNQAKMHASEDKDKTKWRAPSFDPRTHDCATLNAFVGSLPEDEQHFVRHSLKRAQRRRQALANFENALGEGIPEQSGHAKAMLSRLASLMRYTRAHPNFEESYNCLPSHRPEWAMPKQSGNPQDVQELDDVLDRLIGIDCEMVATASDDAALARLSVVNGKSEVLLDRLVAPDETPTDMRTHITGIAAKDLEGLQYRREDARADLLKFVTPSTIFVGHTLDKDLGALRLDMPLVIDVSLLYGLEGSPTRRPALKYLMEYVLGDENFRGDDRQHDSTNDANAAMRMLLHRLSYPEKDVAKVVLPPPPLSGVDANTARILYAHRILDRPGMFTALAALFASAGEGMGSQSLESIEMHAASKGWRSANVLFSTAAEAERVFLALGASSASFDRAGRPQKLVEMSIPGGETTKVYVRTMDAKQGASSVSKDQHVASASPSNKSSSTAPGVAARDWKGWKRALDDELAAAGGALPWKRLRSLLVARCRDAGAASDQGDEALDDQALACIPLQYLSRVDALVRKTTVTK